MEAQFQVHSRTTAGPIQVASKQDLSRGEVATSHVELCTLEDERSTDGRDICAGQRFFSLSRAWCILAFDSCS